MRKFVVVSAALGTVWLSTMAQAAVPADRAGLRMLAEQGLRAYQKGAFGEAETAFRNALKAADQLPGDQAKTAKGIAYTNLGAACLAQDKFAEAEEAYQQSISVKEVAFGKNSPLVADSLGHYAALLRRQKRFQEAEQLQLRAEMIQLASTPSTAQPKPSVTAIRSTMAADDHGAMRPATAGHQTAAISKIIMPSERDKEKLWNPETVEAGNWKGRDLTGARVSGDQSLDFIRDLSWLEVRYSMAPSVTERILKSLYEGGSLVELDNGWLMLCSRELHSRNWHEGMHVELTAKYVNGESIYTAHNGRSEFIGAVVAERR